MLGYCQLCRLAVKRRVSDNPLYDSSAESEMKKPLIIPVLFVMGLACYSISVDSADNKDASLEVAVLDESNWEKFAPRGKEVDAIYGDIVLQNKHLTAVIAKPVSTRNANMTVRQVGGCLIDLTSTDFQSDQLSCFYPGRRTYIFQSFETESNDDSVSVTVKAPGNADRPAMEVTYSLGKDARTLTMTSRLINTSKKTLTVPFSDEIRADGGKEDMSKTANGIHELYTIDDRHWEQAYGLTVDDRRIQSNSNARSSTLKYLTQSNLDSIVIDPDSSHEIVRNLSAGRTRMHAIANLSNEDTSSVTIQVKDGLNGLIPRCRLELSDADGKLIGVAYTGTNSEASFPLSPGVYSAKLIKDGKFLLSGVALNVTNENLPMTIRAENYKPGIIKGKLIGENGTGIPCKIEFTGLDDTPTPNFGPETGEFAVRNLRYAPLGEFSQSLAAGKYKVLISHGAEFDIIEQTIDVESGQAVALVGTLKRSLNTPGWVSGEFHSHSSPSGDNSGSQLGRVLNLVCEHLEFIPCTEHNRVSTYQPHIDQLKVNAFASTVSGMELTGSPLPLNHQNAFPMHYHPHRQDGGGPQTDSDPSKQIQRIAAWDNGSEKLIQQNHPDVGWLFYDKNGDGKPDGGFEGSHDHIDVMEIHPVSHALRTIELDGVTAGEAKGNRVFKWLQLLNQGYRIPGVVNTDAHYNFHGSGWVRNWIQSSTDDPAQIDHMEMVHMSEQGRVVMSNGPYLEVWCNESGAKDKVTVGQDLTAKSGKVDLAIQVQCANWCDVNTVAILVNGKPRKDLHFTREKNPKMFSDGVMKFDQNISIALEDDSHLVVVTGNVGGETGPIYGANKSKIPPTAFGNPVFVDVDGGGFFPNEDTLGLPLPVKGD